jgi:hypothetical protein
MTVSDRINKKMNSHYKGQNARVIGDLALVLIPVLEAVVSNAPNIGDEGKYWLSSLLTTSLVLCKFITKLWQE